MRYRIPVIALALCVVGAPALAHGGHDDYARVTDVDPLTRTVQVSTPREECWYETVRYREPHRGNDTAGLVIGGIVGGLLGNQVGGGDGRRVATVAGTILGAGVGREIADRDHHRYGGSRRVRRCETVEETHYETRTIGYRVHYRYHGEDYVTRMDHDPGRRLRVRLDVTPLE